MTAYMDAMKAIERVELLEVHPTDEALRGASFKAMLAIMEYSRSLDPLLKDGALQGAKSDFEEQYERDRSAERQACEKLMEVAAQIMDDAANRLANPQPAFLLAIESLRNFAKRRFPE